MHRVPCLFATGLALVVAAIGSGCSGEERRAERPPARAETARAHESSAARPRAIDHGPRSRREVALTFDADMTEEMLARVRSGEEDAYDRDLVRKLERWRVPATIFVTGLWAETYPEATRSFARNPLFELGNHSYSHAAWTSDCYGLPSVSSRREKRREVERAARRIEALSSAPPRWFRFPGLCHRPSDLRLVASLGEQVVDGDVASGDPFQEDPQVVVRTVLSETRPGSIIVMHLMGPPHSPATATALETIVPELRAQGYRFVTLSELLRGPREDRP